MQITLFGKEYFINKVLAISIFIFLIIGSGVLGYFLKQVYQPLQAPVAEENTKIVQSDEPELAANKEKEEPVPEIKVYVTGCVNSPGVVTIKKGQVIDDAIKIAGGATKEADLENINLAYQLNENTMLRIKSKTANTVTEGGPAAAGSKTGLNKSTAAGSAKAPKTSQSGVKTNQPDSSNKINSGIDIVKDSLGTVVGESGEKEEGDKKNSLTNINKASQAELENLPNVGPATAKAIIDYREKNGGFKKITEIMKITGIKQKTYDKIKDFICIE